MWERLDPMPHPLMRAFGLDITHLGLLRFIEPERGPESRSSRGSIYPTPLDKIFRHVPSDGITVAGDMFDADVAAKRGFSVLKECKDFLKVVPVRRKTMDVHTVATRVEFVNADTAPGPLHR